MAAGSPPGAVYVLVDVSGSTGGQASYWREVASILASACQGSARVIVVPWDAHTFPHMTPDAFTKEFVSKCRGEGGTASAAPAKYLCTLSSVLTDAALEALPPLARLVLVTDGECSDNEAADAILGGRVFPFAECYIIETRSGSANMSVTAPFTRGAHIVTHIDCQRGGGTSTVVSRATDDDFAVCAALESITTLEEFDEQEDALTRAIQAVCLGTAGDAALRQRLLCMQQRVTRSMSERGGAATGIAAALAAAYDDGGDRAAKRAAICAALPERGGGIGARFSWLLAMTAGAVRRTFRADEIKLQRAAHAGVAAPVSPGDVPEAEAAAAAGAAAEPWACPVSLEEDGTPLVLLHEPLEGGGGCVLAGLDAGTTQWVCNQPLGIAGDVLAAFLGRFGHPVALATWKAAAAAGEPFTQDPLTRRPVCPRIALPLGANAEHAAAADAALLHVFSGGRKVVSPDWLFAVWALAVMRGEPQVAFLTDIASHARAQLVWRLRHRTSYAGLSGLPDMATVRVPLAHGLAFVYDGAVVNDAAARLHLPYLRSTVRPLLALLYEPDPESDVHILRLSVLSDMQAMAAKNPAQWAVTQSTLAACFRGAYPLDGGPETLEPRVLELEGPSWVPYVPLDGPPDPAVAAGAWAQLPRRWTGRAGLFAGDPPAPGLPLSELVHLASLVDPQKKARKAGDPCWHCS